MSKTSTVGPHLIVDAKAGTGKTTTLLEGLNSIQQGVKKHKPGFKPSTQQRDIWRAMRKGKKPQTMMMCAFNKSIAKELEDKVPLGVEAGTLHSMGYRAVSAYFGRGRLKMNDRYKTTNLIEEIRDADIRELRKKKFDMLQAVNKLVTLCKLKMVGVIPGEPDPIDDEEIWHSLPEVAAFHDIQMNGDAEEISELVCEILRRGCDMEREDFEIDYPDMLWLPVVKQLRIVKRDLLLVDEAQDLSPVQQELALMAGKRLVLCGDPHQAIYGFAGADTNSMNNMMKMFKERREDCEVLPLNTTYRCPKSVVKLAQSIVPEYEAYEDNAEGKVSRIPEEDQVTGVRYTDGLQPEDMILCRTNAPLVSTCFKLLASKKKATIIGRDIGQGLVRMVKKMKATGIADLMDKIEAYRRVEIEKINARKNPNDDLKIMIEDKVQCLMVFCHACITVDEVVKKIESVFQDKNYGSIRLSSIHRSKGLEANRVFILRDDLLPHPMAKTKEARLQEMNLKYVAITRAIEELTFVESDQY